MNRNRSVRVANSNDTLYGFEMFCFSEPFLKWYPRNRTESELSF